jgi:energy-coupling factor transporter ATP-binding protein EcfA2
MNRHIKKYYFYFLARIFDIFKQYEKSISYYSKVIKYRTFFWDVQKRYAYSFEKGPKNSSLQIQGGIGDFLQHLPFMLKNKSIDYIVATHYLDAKTFFDDLGIKVKKYYFYINLDEYKAVREKLNKLNHSYICPRSLFFANSPFDPQAHSNIEKLFTVGIHMGASILGSDKALSVNFIRSLIKELIALNYKIILFGTHEEIRLLNMAANKNISTPTNKKIIYSLPLVSHCNLFIGSDSVFKTMASMLKITTIVLHEDIVNNFRDRVFIKPYVDREVMFVYRYKMLEGAEINRAIEYVLEICRSKFNIHKN